MPDMMAEAMRSMALEGAAKVAGFISPSLAGRMRADVFAWRSEQSKDRPEGMGWGAHHFVEAPSMMEFLGSTAVAGFCDAFFAGAPCILQGVGASINPPRGMGSYAHGSAWHRDLLTYRGASREYVILMLMLDPFTVENGCTQVAARTHLREAWPGEAELDALRVDCVGEPGDALMFYPDTVHRAGGNQTDGFRVGVTLAFCRPYFKPLMDYARMLGLDRGPRLGGQVAQLLGYNALTPQSMAEWNMPAEGRFYKKGQG